MSEKPGVSRVVIHLLWTIAVLLLGIVAILTGMASGDKINEFLSFASSLASLVLAVVAIFYSFVSNRDVGANLATLAGSADRTHDASQSVLSSAEQLGEIAELIRSDLESIRPTLDQMSGQVSEVRSILDAGSPAGLEKGGDGNGMQALQSGRIANGGVVALYLLLRSHKEKRFADVKEIFPEDIAWQSYVAGFIGSISFLHPFGIKIVVDSSKFFVEELGSVDIEDLKIRISEKAERDEVVKSANAKIDEYFEGEKPQE